MTPRTARFLRSSSLVVTLVFVGTGSMLAAALVLLLSSTDKRRAAITQGALPALAIVALVIGLLIG